MGGIQAAGHAPEVKLQVLLCIASAALALLGAVRSAHQPESAAGALAAGPLAAALVGLGTALTLAVGWDPADLEVLQRRAVSHGAAMFLLPLVALPSVSVAAAGIGWLGSRPPRRPLLAAWVLVPGGLATALVVLGSMGQADAVFSWVRAVGLAGATGGLAVGALRDDPRGEEARAAALAVLVLVVAGLEASYGGLVTILTLKQVSVLVPETWGQGLEAFDAIVRRPLLAGWGAFVVVAIGALASLRSVGNGTRGAVVAAVVVGAALLGSSRPGSDRLQTLAVLCPPTIAADTAP